MDCKGAGDLDDKSRFWHTSQARGTIGVRISSASGRTPVGPHDVTPNAQWAVFVAERAQHHGGHLPSVQEE
jgi:hypothetical protein